MLLEATPPADLPESAKLTDGHDDARPWQKGFVEQTGQLEKANERPPAIDHIYRTCLEEHRRQLKKSNRGPIGRLFGATTPARPILGERASWYGRGRTNFAGPMTIAPWRPSTSHAGLRRS